MAVLVQSNTSASLKLIDPLRAPLADEKRVLAEVLPLKLHPRELHRSASSNPKLCVPPPTIVTQDDTRRSELLGRALASG